MAASESVQATSEILKTGTLGILLVFLISAICIFSFEQHYFVDYVATAFMAATPCQVVLGLFWNNSVPGLVEKQSAPIKGLLLTLITMSVGALVMLFLIYVIGGGHEPSPMLIQYAILTVVATLWLILVWGCWPVTLLTKNPVLIGVGTLVLAYVLAYIVQMVFFNYEFLGTIGHPHYHPELDPKGLFPFWPAISFIVTTVMVIVATVLFDFWPINALAKSAVQPLRGLIGTVYVLIVTALIFALFISVLGMDYVDFMVRVPVCFIFGAFLVNNMMQFSLFNGVAQPLRGVLLVSCAAVTALLMHALYSYVSSFHTGQVLGTGPANGFARELWIASATLGITFPVVFLVSGFFSFWPIKRG